MTHDDGTPMSTNNHFYWRTGEPSIFLKEFMKSAKSQQSAQEAVAAGKLTSGVYLHSQEERDKTRSIRNSK